MTTPQELGSQLAAARKRTRPTKEGRKRGRTCLTQKELADELGVSPSCIGQLENGVFTPGFELLSSLADRLRLDPEVLEGKIEEAKEVTRIERLAKRKVKRGKPSLRQCSRIPKELRENILVILQDPAKASCLTTVVEALARP